MYETSLSLSCRRQVGFMCTRSIKYSCCYIYVNSIFEAEIKKQENSLLLSVNFRIFVIVKTYNYAKENIHHTAK